MKKFIVVVALLFAIAFIAFGSPVAPDFDDVTLMTVQPANSRDTIAGLSLALEVQRIQGMFLIIQAYESYCLEPNKLINAVFSASIAGGVAVRLKYPQVVFQSFINLCPEIGGGATV